jgi:peroxiredoxin
MEEMPTIVKLHNTLKNEAFEVVSINVDEDPAKVVPGIIKKFGMEFPVYVDSEEKLAAAFHVVAIPYNIVIGKDHKISWTESGERDWASDEILSKFRGLMK